MCAGGAAGSCSWPYTPSEREKMDEQFTFSLCFATVRLGLGSVVILFDIETFVPMKRDHFIFFILISVLLQISLFPEISCVTYLSFMFALI